MPKKRVIYGPNEHIVLDEKLILKRWNETIDNYIEDGEETDFIKSNIQNLFEFAKLMDEKREKGDPYVVTGIIPPCEDHKEWYYVVEGCGYIGETNILGLVD